MVYYGGYYGAFTKNMNMFGYGKSLKSRYFHTDGCS